MISTYLVQITHENFHRKQEENFKMECVSIFLKIEDHLHFRDLLCDSSTRKNV